ncbi:ATP-binding protein [Aliiroseovarius subalbicans]|uniref:sensor histidine kinase n=1 Tax=Aliiroseovarius subalbicans TaxID=2925840 RepID=UPI001F59AF91|nr:ATP-binding protein [Aliiroseovarius subalbicans]MCI2400326.1 ATP-binding protein [Aliiroseovarius subalbicans]
MLLQKTLETGAETTTSLSIKAGFGTVFQMSIRRVPVVDRPDGIALVLTFEDRSSLLDVKAMRSDFVANVSHEIRSPLTAISGFVETLLGPARDDPAAQERFLQLMDKEVARMTNLVSDLLSLSRVEVKERRAPKKTVDPNQIILQAEEIAEAFARKHGKTLVVTTNGVLPEILGNHDDLVRVLINLFENAVTYSREGGEIRMSADVDCGDNPLNKTAIRISVCDQGEGIPAAEIPRLTERFYRVDKSRSRSVGGTGLGLAIVKHILLRHRGKLEIESTLGEGSEFRIYLPIAETSK